MLTRCSQNLYFYCTNSWKWTCYETSSDRWVSSPNDFSPPTTGRVHGFCIAKKKELWWPHTQEGAVCVCLCVCVCGPGRVMSLSGWWCVCVCVCVCVCSCSSGALSSCPAADGRTPAIHSASTRGHHHHHHHRKNTMPNRRNLFFLFFFIPLFLFLLNQQEAATGRLNNPLAGNYADDGGLSRRPRRRPIATDARAALKKMHAKLGEWHHWWVSVLLSFMCVCVEFCVNGWCKAKIVAPQLRSWYRCQRSDLGRPEPSIYFFLHIPK